VTVGELSNLVVDPFAESYKLVKVVGFVNGYQLILEFVRQAFTEEVPLGGGIIIGVGGVAHELSIVCGEISVTLFEVLEFGFCGVNAVRIIKGLLQNLDEGGKIGQVDTVVLEIREDLVESISLKAVGSVSELVLVGGKAGTISYLEPQLAKEGSEFGAGTIEFVRVRSFLGAGFSCTLACSSGKNSDGSSLLSNLFLSGCKGGFLGVNGIPKFLDRVLGAGQVYWIQGQDLT
jgi:hypothetical protein